MLTRIQIAALHSVAHPEDLFPGGSHAHGNTMHALERKGLIEHTSLGWRLTNDGHDVLVAQHRRPARQRRVSSNGKRNR